MKKLTRLVLVLIMMGFLPVMFMDCGPCKCNDDGKTFLYLTESVTLEPRHLIPYMNKFDSTYYNPYDSVFVEIQAGNMKKIAKQETLQPLLFTTVAYACDCVGPEKQVRNYISSIQIFSEMDGKYNDTLDLKKGDLLNDYFGIKADFYQKSTSTIPLFLKHFRLPDYYNRTQYIFVGVKPSVPLELLYTIEIKFNDGKKFRFENQKLRVK
jgi:hypothetical protein